MLGSKRIEGFISAKGSFTNNALPEKVQSKSSKG